MSHKSKLFLDFDGTLVDNRRRMYEFCVDWWPAGRFNEILTIDEYWALKRLSIREDRWAMEKLDVRVDPVAWTATKLAHMEDDRYLAMDELVPGSLRALQTLAGMYDLVLVSRRERPDSLRGELQALEVERFFSDALVLSHGGSSKADAILERFRVSPTDVLVGDTEDDMMAGVALEVSTFLVLTGIRGRWIANKPGFERVRVCENLTAVVSELMS